jgi:glycosyltransferase involved in cell wall biosynthesis
MKFLFVGNTGNKGINFAEHVNQSGHQVKLIFAPLQDKRCTLEDFYGPNSKKPSWIELFDKQSLREMIGYIIEIHRNFDFVIASGAFEAANLISNGIPFFWFISGAEITEQPFGVTKASIEYRKLIMLSGLKYIRGLISNHNDTRFAARLLGLSNKIIPICDVPFILPEFASSSKLHHEKVILASYTRRVYEGSYSHSKGSEHIVSFLRNLKISGRDKKFSIRLTLDGIDSDRFEKEVKSIGLSEVHFLSSLSRYQLAMELTKYSPIVLDQFGEKERVVSGIIREAIALGCPVVTDNVFYPRFAINLSYPVPTIWADNALTIDKGISSLLDDPKFMAEFVISLKSYSHLNFNSSRFISILIDNIKSM